MIKLEFFEGKVDKLELRITTFENNHPFISEGNLTPKTPLRQPLITMNTCKVQWRTPRVFVYEEGGDGRRGINIKYVIL